MTGAASTSRCGSHSSQVGRYQVRSPSRVIALGSTTERISVASRMQRDRDAEAHLLELHEVAAGEAGEDDDDDQRCSGDDPGRGRDPEADGVARVAALS